MTARFGRVIPAMVTPFSDNGALNVDASVALAKWLVEEGSEGLVITGTTGEGPAVTDEEDWELWRAISESVTEQLLEKRFFALLIHEPKCSEGEAFNHYLHS